MTRRWWPGGLPVFWHTLGMLVLGLLIVQGVGLAILFLIPPPRPEFNRLADVTGVLSGQPVEREGREAQLLLHLQPDAPVLPDRLTSDPEVTHEFADRLKVTDDAVRLYFEPDARPFPFGARRGGVRSAIAHHHEPIFFGKLRAGLRTPRGWLVADTSKPPLISPWQRRMIAWFAIAVAGLVPLAWMFARALSRQIRRFADAADRVGADVKAPAMREEGVAELRTAARALNRMQSRLADYVSERTAMIGAIAHDLRTPLARVAFRVEAADEPVREKVLADVSQMQAMISAAIGFVRNTQDRGERVPLDVAALLEAIVEQDRDLGRAVTLEHADSARVLGDPLGLERLIQNLIDNGLAYGGCVTVRLARNGPTAVLTIVDAGPGLAPELLERVFQPFARGDPSRNRQTGGIGLGLTIARTIAEDHGGAIRLANRDGGGLEARVELPLLAA